MKKFIILSLAVAFSVSLMAQEKKNVEFAEKTHDFGVVQEGAGENGKITAVFTFTNVSTTPVFIASINTGCGCTTSQIDSNKPILPGDTGDFSISYNTLNRAGQRIDRTITVNFKDGGDNVFMETVQIKGEVAKKEQK